MNRRNQIPVWEASEYTYPCAGGFIPNLTAYLHEEEEKRAGLIICPGGGYFCVSPTEGELVAKKFYEKGYNCFVLSYTTNPMQDFPLFDQPLKDISRAIRFVRAHGEEFHIIDSRLYLCGFSAAGHLCASVCDHHQEIQEENPVYQKYSNRPDGAILSYPVITSGEYAHQDSFRFLLGMDIYERKDAEAEQLLAHYSLEKNVTPENPPCFLWHTATDGLVPPENSLLYAAALKEHGIPYALHIFSKGPHGLSLANADWASRRCFGEPYTLDQFVKIREALKADTLPVSEKRKTEFLEMVDGCFDMGEETPVYPEITIWPDLADAFLKELEVEEKNEN